MSEKRNKINRAIKNNKTKSPDHPDNRAKMIIDHRTGRHSVYRLQCHDNN